MEAADSYETLVSTYKNKGDRSMVQGVNRISPRRTECYPSAVLVGFAVGKVTL